MFLLKESQHTNLHLQFPVLLLQCLAMHRALFLFLRFVTGHPLTLCLFCRWHVRKKTLNLSNLCRQNYGELGEDCSPFFPIVKIYIRLLHMFCFFLLLFLLSPLTAGLTSLLNRITSYTSQCRKESAPLVRGFSSDPHTTM